MQIKEIVRLKYQFNQSVRAIADSVGCSKSTVANVLETCKTHEFNYESIKQYNDDELHQIFYPNEKVESDIILPDWKEVDGEINARGSRKNIRFMYSKCFANGETDVSRSYFYQKYREWKKTSNSYIYSPIDRKPGQNLYIDWVGPTVDCVKNLDTGELKTAYFFITTLGLSSYPFCLACEHMSQTYWNEAHIKALKWYGGISECWVPDNTKTAVISRKCYDIQLNKSYREMGMFYNVAIIPARVRSPRDKGSAEQFVREAETWILEKIKDHDFFSSFEELNIYVYKLTRELARNIDSDKKIKVSREDIFLQYDKPYLLPLPANDYDIYDLKIGTISNTYTAEYKGCEYTVPYKYAFKPYELHARHNLIEIYINHKRVATHQKAVSGIYRISSDDHMPKKDYYYKVFINMDNSDFKKKASEIGPNALKVIDYWLGKYDKPQQGYKMCFSIINLADTHLPSIVEAACKRALKTDTVTAKEILNIILNKLYLVPVDNNESGSKGKTPIIHENIRGQYK